MPSYLEGSKTTPTKEELDELIKKGGPAVIILDAFDPKNIKTKKEDSNAVYNTAEITVNPEFPNGMEDFYKFVGENFTIPETPKDVKLAGKINDEAVRTSYSLPITIQSKS